MTWLQDGTGGYLTLFLSGVLAQEPWRWLGLYLGRGIDPDSEIFRWVRAVATALVAGLVMRILVFAPGALMTVEPWLRAAAFGYGLLAYYMSGRKVVIGMASGMIVMIVGKTALTML
jgi:hypothetical protein